MGKYIDLTGKRFGRLVVIKRAEHEKYGRVAWECLCDCGKKTVVNTNTLKSHHTQSCGCFLKEMRFTHGMHSTRLYGTWAKMKNRCLQQNCKSYPDYGGRGIQVCDEWKNDFMSFYHWSMANGYSDDLTIDRIDVNGDYSPDNCRWATPKEQNNNKRNSRYYWYQGRKRTISEWAEIFQIDRRTLDGRLNRGYSFHDAISSPINIKFRNSRCKERTIK